MELRLDDRDGSRRSVYEVREDDLGVLIRVSRRKDDYLITVFDLETMGEVGRVPRKRWSAAVDYAHACVA